jgi:hypothetical protein
VPRRESAARPDCVQRGKGRKGDASSLNTRSKAASPAKNNVPAPVSRGDTAENIQGQCAA